ncbi:ankyrin repeat domain-containing protein [Kineococcus esterisolvens]|uniref:ankyrin repeat domain-containing protein n=1 Tax=unclassified Kineococcus TaxID=2621656 RepID=UPI003D7F0C7D
MTGRGEDGGRWAEPVGPRDAGEERALELAHRVFETARRGLTRELCGYLDAGVPVASTDSAGDCLLVLAAYHGHPGTVRALLERGADPDAVDAAGRTALTAAVFRGYRDVVAALVDADADPYAGTPSALEAARFFGREEVLDLLEVPGAELDGT